MCVCVYIYIDIYIYICVCIYMADCKMWNWNVCKTRADMMERLNSRCEILECGCIILVNKRSCARPGRPKRLLERKYVYFTKLYRHLSTCLPVCITVCVSIYLSISIC